jgi:hypothetical protein
MKLKQATAFGGQVYNIKLDVQSVLCMDVIRDELESTLHIRPSKPLMIRRALRVYGEYIQGLPQTVGAWDTERQQIRQAAGRKGRTQ